MKVELLGLKVVNRSGLVGRLIVDRHDDATSTLQVIIDASSPAGRVQMFEVRFTLTVLEACRLIGALQGSETLLGASETAE